MSNLLSNAIKYGAGQPIEVKVSQEDDVARITVRDHGLGIPQDSRERIFERFERVAPLRHFGGFGLGLWIVRRVVEAHGGRVTVWSNPNQGSEFVVELPTQPRVTRAPRPPHSTPMEVHP
jgi:signal transduction histidine kinase